MIVGAGGFGRECLDIVEALNDNGAEIRFVGFVDDGGCDEDLLARRSARCLGPTSSAHRYADRYVIAIGDANARVRLDHELTEAGLQAAILIHPQATLGSDCRVGDGTILNAGARATTNITFGRHVQLHANCTVGHDAMIGDYVSIFPGATVSGSVTLGRGVTVGTGANVLPGVKVGAHAYVGAGAVVTRDVTPGETVVGVPANPVRSRQ